MTILRSGFSPVAVSLLSLLLGGSCSDASLDDEAPADTSLGDASPADASLGDASSGDTSLDDGVSADSGLYDGVSTDSGPDGEPPVFTSGSTATMQENETDTGYTATAEDPEGQPITFLLTGGEDRSAFDIGATSGVLTFVTPPDFESPTDADADNTYQVEITAAARGPSASQTVAVTVTDESLLSAGVSYPTPNANVAGVSQTIVTVTVTDAEDGVVTVEDVRFIEVEGEMASPDTDDAGRWSVRVPVERPRDTLSISLELADGTTDSLDLELANMPLLSQPTDLVVDAANNRALLVDTGLVALLAVDLATGDRTVLSDNSTGAGRSLAGPLSVALDSANDRAVVVDEGFEGLLAVDLASGDRSVLSDSGTGAGPSLSGPIGVELDPSNDRLLVLDSNRLVAVDLATGDRTIVSDDSTGAGPSFFGTRDMAVDTVNSRALVMNVGPLVDVDLDVQARDLVVMAVDLSSGDRTILIENNRFANLRSMALDASNDRVLVLGRADWTNNDALLSVDLSSGDSTYLSSPWDRGGPVLTTTSHVAVDSTNNRALVTQRYGPVGTVVSVDLSTGEGTVQSGSTGEGPPFSYVRRVALDPGNNRALVVDGRFPDLEDAMRGLRALMAVDLASGDRTVLSDDATGAGPAFLEPGMVALDSANNRVLVWDGRFDDGPGALVVVEPTTGDRTVLSGRYDSGDGRTGTGPNFSNPCGLAVDSANNWALVAQSDWDLAGVLTVDLSSGDRHLLSGRVEYLGENLNRGAGFDFSAPRGVAPDPANDRVVVLDAGLDALLAVDLASGDRTVLSDSDTGTGPGFGSYPLDVAVDTPNNRAMVLTWSPTLLVVVDLSSGDRTLLPVIDTGAGPRVEYAASMAVDWANHRAFLLEGGLRALLVVELGSVERAVVSQ